jgi:anti-anti-sigma regulatory factor
MSNDPPAPFAVENSADGVVIALRGEVRVDCVQGLHAALCALASRAVRVRIDWSGAEHVDACVLQTLLAFVRSRSEAGVPPEHCAAPRALQDYLRLGGFAAGFPGALAATHSP